MEDLFREFCSFDKYESVLQEPLDADVLALQPDHFCHEFSCVIIKEDNIKRVNNVILIKKLIECVYFIYVDLGEKEFDAKYWFFIGKLNNNVYFSYESDCCGTGFGLGSKSSLCMATSQELLYNYGLTDKHRKLIIHNISKRFNSFIQ